LNARLDASKISNTEVEKSISHAAVRSHNRAPTDCACCRPPQTGTNGRLRDDLALGGCAAGDGAGNPFGDVECGQWYSRSMSGWSVLPALQGFTYNGAAHELGFDPRWRPDDHSSFFTAGTSYGTLSQRAHGSNQTDTLHVSSGSLRLDRVRLAVGSHAVRQVRVSIDHRQVDAHWSTTAGGLVRPVLSTTNRRPSEHRRRGRSGVTVAICREDL
jgi:hypothetical protein